MTIKEAILQIVKSILPDSINGIHIKYDLRKAQSCVFYDSKDFVLTIMPIVFNCENVAVSLRISPDQYADDICAESMSYRNIEKAVEEMLIVFIKNIKEHTNG